MGTSSKKEEGLCHKLHLPGLLQSEPLSPQQATADLCLHKRHSNTQRQVWLSLLCVPWVLVCRRLHLSPPSISGRFDSEHDFAPPTILLGLLLCPWMWGIFFWWDPTFSCRWLFSGWLQFCSSYRRWAHILLLRHLQKELINRMDIPKCASLPIITISLYDIIIAKCISYFIILACLGLLFLILEIIFIT